jgi:hypothetical protein
MRTTIFAQSNTSKVDNAITTDGVVVYDTINPQLADLVSNDNLDMVAGNKYTFNVTGTMDGSQITWSKDNALNSYSVFEEDGTTPAIGTDYNDITRLDVFFDGAKLSIIASGVSDAIDVELTPFDDITSTNVQDGMEEINAKVNSIKVVEKEVLAMPSGEKWTKQTELNVLPDADGWTLTQTGGTSVITSGVLNVTTSGTILRNYDIETGNISTANIKRLDTRLQVNANTGPVNAPSQAILIQDGTRFIRAFIKTDGIDITDDAFATVNAFSGDLTSAFNVIRIELDTTLEARIYVNGILEHTQPYANLATTANNDIAFGDFSATSELYSSNIDYDYIYYQLDLAANPDGQLWLVDGEFLSAEITTVNTILVADSFNFFIEPTTLVAFDFWETARYVKKERIDDNTIKLFVVNQNQGVFDFELVITKDKASIT